MATVDLDDIIPDPRGPLSGGDERGDDSFDAVIVKRFWRCSGFGEWEG